MMSDPSGLAAPAALPEGWEVARLGDVVEPRRDLTQPSSDGKARYVGLEHIDSGNARLSRWGIESEVKSSKSKFFADDVLYGKLRPYLDKVALAEWEGLCATDILVFVADKQRALPDFVVHLLHTRAFLNHAIVTTSGTNHPRTSWQALQTFIFALPPLPEQRAIARVLSTLQRAIEAQDKLIAAAHELKRALMRHLFTCGAVPPADAARVPLRETEVGAVPEGWRLKRIGELAIHVGSGVTPRGGAKTYLDRGIPLIRSQNVLMNRLSLDDVAYISTEIHTGMQRSAVKPGDVLLNITGASIGRVAVVPETLKEANVNQHVCCIRLGEEMIPDFLAYYLATEKGQWQITSTQIGATRQGLNYQQVRGFQIPMSPRSEQRAVARILSAVDNKIETEEKRKAALQSLFKTMLHQLMTGQVRVKAEG
jgi:type I restriction enzyme S subunit